MPETNGGTLGDYPPETLETISDFDILRREKSDMRK
jgi:hypothetical protein